MIFGQASAAELEDLVKAKDYTLAQLGAAWRARGPAWSFDRADDALAWEKDWQALQDRYGTARDAALRRLGSARVQGRVQAGVLETLVLGPVAGAWAASDAPDLRNVPAQAEWDGILVALKRAYDPKTGQGPVSPGDLDDLDRRLRDATKQDVDYSQTPQPRIDSDADLNLFKKADVALRTVGVLPPGKDQFPWARVIAGGVAGGVAGAYLLPHYLLQLVGGGAALGWLSTKPWTRW